MKFVVSGGGTAGHVNPAIACARELMVRGHEVLYVGTPTGPESRLAPASDLPFLAVEAAGFNRKHIKTLFTSSAVIYKSSLKLRRLFKQERYDGVVGFGGYVSLPVGMAAQRCGIPLILHEQNSVPGLANKLLADKSSAIAVTYEMSRSAFKSKLADRIVVTGNPVRESVLAGDRGKGRELFSVPEDALLLLVFGGSLGAQHMNTALLSMKDELMAIPNLYVVQATGEKKYQQIVDELGEVPEGRWQLFPYINQMGDALAACDLVVSRAGATSLAEITSLGVPSILIPFPQATDDHQTKNARDLSDAGAAVLVPDDQLDTEAFRGNVLDLLANPQRREAMAAAAKSIGRPNAAVLLADVVMEATSKTQGR